MAGKAQSLKVMITGDAKNLNKTLEGVQGKLAGFGKRTQAAGMTMSKFVTGPIVGAVAGLGALAMKTSGAADATAKAARAAGLGSDAYQELRFALGQAGIEEDQFAKAATRLTQELGKAADGNDKAASAFGNLGVSIRDANGDMRSSDDVMNDVLAGLAAIPNDAERSAKASELFGRRAGPELAGALAQGIGGIDEARQKAHDLGIVLSGESLTAAEKFQDQWDDLKSAFGGAVAEMGSSLMPMLTGQLLPAVKDRLVPAVRSFAEKVSGLVEWFTNLSPRTKAVIGAFVGLAAAIGPVLVVVGKLATVFSGLVPMFAAVTGPVGLVVAGVAGLAAGLIYAYQHSETFRNVVNAAFEKVQEVVGPIVSWLGDRLRSVGEFFGFTRQTVGEQVAAMSNEAVGEVVDMVAGMTDEARMLVVNGEALSAELADAWIGNVNRMRDDTITAANEQHAQSVAIAGQLHTDLGTISAEQRDAIIGEANAQRDGAVTAATDQAAKVTAEIERQRASGVTVTHEQAAAIVSAMEGQRDNVITALTDQSHQSEAILARLKAESGRLTLETAAAAIANSANQRDETVAAAQKEYEDRVAEILALQRDSDTFTAEMAATAIAEARTMRDDTISAAAEQHSGVVTEVAGMREGVTREVDTMTGDVISDFDRFKTSLVDWHVRTAFSAATVIGEFRNVANRMREWVGETSIHIAAVIAHFAGIPGRVIKALSGLAGHMFTIGKIAVTSLLDGVKSIGSSIGDAIKGMFNVSLPSIKIPFVGDGPGAPIGPGGKAMDRARQAAVGLPIRMSSGYRTPAHNKRVGGSPTSYHLDRINPASDWVGPTWALDKFAALLRKLGGWRELLWRVPNHAPGDNPHVHVAHEGGLVTRRGIAPLPDELDTRLQVGEIVLPKGRGRGGEGGELLEVLRSIDRRLADLDGGNTYIDARGAVEGTAEQIERALADHDRQSSHKLRVASRQRVSR